MNPLIKKIILIVLVSIAGLFLLAAVGWYFFSTTQFAVYQDDQYKFSIKYPKAWKVVPHYKPNTVVLFLRPKDTALDLIQENFNVTIQPMPDTLSTMDAFTARVKMQMLAVFGRNMRFVEDKPMAWGWRQGHLIVMYENPPNHLMIANAWVSRSNLVYIMTYLGDENKYPKNSILVNEMIRSFQLN